MLAKLTNFRNLTKMEPPYAEPGPQPTPTEPARRGPAPGRERRPVRRFTDISQSAPGALSACCWTQSSRPRPYTLAWSATAALRASHGLSRSGTGATRALRELGGLARARREFFADARYRGARGGDSRSCDGRKGALPPWQRTLRRKKGASARVAEDVLPEERCVDRRSDGASSGRNRLL